MLITKLISIKVIGTKNWIIKTSTHHQPCLTSIHSFRQLERLVRQHITNQRKKTIYLETHWLAVLNLEQIRRIDFGLSMAEQLWECLEQEQCKSQVIQTNCWTGYDNRQNKKNDSEDDWDVLAFLLCQSANWWFPLDLLHQWWSFDQLSGLRCQFLSYCLM